MLQLRLRVKVRVLGLSPRLGLQAVDKEQVALAHKLEQVCLALETRLRARVRLRRHGVKAQKHEVVPAALAARRRRGGRVREERRRLAGDLRLWVREREVR